MKIKKLFENDLFGDDLFGNVKPTKKTAVVDDDDDEEDWSKFLGKAKEAKKASLTAAQIAAQAAEAEERERRAARAAMDERETMLRQQRAARERQERQEEQRQREEREAAENQRREDNNDPDENRQAVERQRFGDLPDVANVPEVAALPWNTPATTPAPLQQGTRALAQAFTRITETPPEAFNNAAFVPAAPAMPGLLTQEQAAAFVARIRADGPQHPASDEISDMFGQVRQGFNPTVEIHVGHETTYMISQDQQGYYFFNWPTASNTGPLAAPVAETFKQFLIR